MNKSNILHLVLKYHWYDKIENCCKTHEYREYKEYWKKRLYPLDKWKIVKFQRGYVKNPSTMFFEIKSIKVLNNGINTDLLTNSKVFDIELGNRLESI